MLHTIEFKKEILLDVEVSPNQRLERVLVRQGARLSAEVRPYVIKGMRGFLEVADLFFADGTISRKVTFASFEFVDND